MKLPMCKCGVCDGRGVVLDHARIGSLLRQARLASGKTHKEVGSAIGVSRSMVCLMESGKRGARSMTQDRVEKFLEVVLG